MCTSATSTGVATGSARATPVKSSMYTCKYRGAAAVSPPSHPSARARRVRSSVHLRAAAGGGCASSNRRCAACADAATSVDTLSN
eukprot:184004-Pleurochrysis_carterae.AAC.1